MGSERALIFLHGTPADMKSLQRSIRATWLESWGNKAQLLSRCCIAASLLPDTSPGSGMGP
jgi:hypothetical protein